MNYLIFITPVILTTSCNSCRRTESLTEKEIRSLTQECTDQKEFELNGPICFSGFFFEDVDTVVVYEYTDFLISDSLIVHARMGNKHDDQENKFWTNMEPQEDLSNFKFKIGSSYSFKIGNEKPYLLDNMEMVFTTQYAYPGEKGWRCGMERYTIDGQLSETGNIYINRRKK